MIVREWRALATRDNAQAYIEFFGGMVVPILKTVAGNRGARLMHRESEEGGGISQPPISAEHQYPR